MADDRDRVDGEDSKYWAHVRGRFGGEVARLWARVRGHMRDEFGVAAFNSWLKPMTLAEARGSKVRIAVPTRFMRDWIVDNYADRLQELWHAEYPQVSIVEIIVEPGRSGVLSRPEAPKGGPRPATEVPHSEPAEVAEPIGAVLDQRFTFENFVVGRPNELAHAASRRVADSDRVPFNPLFLYGGVGLGKTHLMHGIAWHISRRNPKRRVLYLSAEKFMYQFIRALRYKTTMAFKEQFRSVDVLMIDDVQFIGGRETTQEEFFHTFNALVDQNRQIIVSADKSPSDLEGMEDRLKSRLGWGLVADIHPTDYELRLGILQAKAERIFGRDGIQVEAKILEFLAHKVMSNVRELEGSLNRVVAFASLVGRPITLDMTQEVLQDLLRASERKISIDEIQRKVAEYYNIRLADMHSARRARAVARPRQVAMYLAKQMTPRSLPEIGRKFGGRDHTTVMYAVRKIEELRAADTVLDEDIDLLRRMLEA